MERDFEAERKALNEIEQDKHADEEIAGDRCPHCGASTSIFTYKIFEPLLGWLECTVCGVVFSPMSVRKQKMERQNTRIKAPKLVRPV